MTKSRFRKNPKYELGDIIRRNLRSENLRRSYDLSTTYREALPGADTDFWYASNTGMPDNEFFPTIDDDGNLVQSESSEPSIFSGIGHLLFGDYENAANRWREASVADTWRLFHEKRLQAETTNKLNKLSEAKQRLNELDAAEKYADLISRRGDLVLQLKFQTEIGNTLGANQIQQQITEIDNEIYGFLEKIKTEGKSSDINIQLFFDPTKASSEDLANRFKESFLGNSDPNAKWYNPMSAIEYGFSALQNILTTAQTGIGELIGENKIGDITRRAIKKSLPEDRWTDNLFINHALLPEAASKKLRDNITSLREYWNDEFEKRSADVRDVSNKYKNGTWYFDPQKINPKFRHYSENNDSGLIGGLLPDQLAYSLAEMGSSYSDWENMAAMMLTDLSVGSMAKGMSFFATKTNPYIAALSVLKDYRDLRAANRLAEAAEMEKAVARAQEVIAQTGRGISTVENALGVSTQGANVYWINRMREHETNSEVIDAWSNRALTNSMQRGADLNKVLNTSRQYLEQIGIDTENMTDIDVIQHALAYDIPTGDTIFEKEKEEGIKGLRKVYNDNMALAVKDYVEVLPFLNYTSSFLRSFGRGATNKFADLTYHAVAKSLFDRAYQKVAGNSLERIGKKLATKHTLEFLGKRLRQASWVGGLEGIEEGQQGLLQSRYARGEYDDYSSITSTFPLASIMEDANLATDAVAAYFGVLWGDPDNASPQIRRAMQIGATTGVLMGGASFGVLSNLVPSTGRDNLRNLIGQIKNDKVLNRLVGEAYGSAQDDAHLDIFYKAFAEHGINNERLRKSLQDLKLFKGQNVTDDYIDRDINLLDNLWFAYNNKKTKELLESKNILPDSDKYRLTLKLLARHLTQEQDGAKLIEKDLAEVEGKNNTSWREVLDAIRDDSREDDAIDVRTDSIVRELQQDYQDYLKAHKNRRSNYVDEIDKLSLEIDRLSKKAVPLEWELKKLEELRGKRDTLKAKDAEFMAKLPDDFLTFAEKRLSEIAAYRFLINSENLIAQLTNRTKVLNEISKELGIDITSSRLQNLIDSIKRKRDELYKSLENEDVQLQNELRLALNESLPEQNKKAKKEGRPVQKKLLLIENIATRLERRYGKLVNQDEIDRLQHRILLNMAVYDSAKAVSRAFARGRIDPRIAYREAAPLQWKSLTDEEKRSFLNDLNKERAKEGKSPLTIRGAALEFTKALKERVKALKKGAKDYEEHLHKHSAQDDTVEGVDADAELMWNDAARNLLDFELSQYEDLKRINHREYLRSASPTELRRRAAEGDDDAKTVLGELIKETLSSGETAPESTTSSSAEEEPSRSSSVEGMEIGYGADTESSSETGSIDDQPSTETDPADVEIASSVEMDPAQFEETARSEKEKELRRRFGMDEEESSTEVYDKDDDLPQSAEIDLDDVQIDETRALYQLQEFGETDYDSYLHTRSERTVQNPDEIYTDFLGQTFKYLPFATTVPKLQNVVKKGDKYVKEPIKLRHNAKLGTGKELGEKLLIPGWFNKAEKYFIVTQDQTDLTDMNNTDNFVVALIILDGDKAYATFMEGLREKTSYGKLSGGYEYLRTKMSQMFYSYFDYQGKRYYLKNPDGSLNEANHELGTGIARKNEYIAQHPSVDPTTVTVKQANDWYLNKATKAQKDAVDFKVRRFLSGTHAVHSNAHIEELIEILKFTRDSIINAVLNKDSEGNYVFKSDVAEMNQVEPANPRISDGAINEQKDDGEYTFRKLTDGGFGMSSNLEELTQLIIDGEIRLGVGRGERAYGDSKGKIDKLDPSENGSYDDAGYGYAGKIYFIAKTVSGRDRGIILAEKKFRPTADKILAEEVEEAFDSTGKLKDGMVPTIAEFILRIITDSIDNSVFSGISAQRVSQLKSALLNMLVNADPSTWVTSKEERSQLYYAQKQFFVDDKGRLVIALLDASGVYRHRDYNVSKLRSDENLRKTVIAAIANNLHWNTDRVLMTNGIESGIMEALYQVFNDNPELEEYSFAGIEDLTFKKSDLFNDDLSYKDVSLVAWMLSTGKLLTTVGDTIFRAPFVYADGPLLINQAKTAANQVVEKTAKLKQEKKPKSSDKPVLDRKENLTARLDSYAAERVGNLFVVTDKKARGEAEGKSGYKVHDYVILDVETGDVYNPKSDEEISNLLDLAVDRYLEYIHQLGIDVKKDAVKKILDSSQYTSVVSGEAMFVAFRTDEGVSITIDTIDKLESASEEGFPIAGVYSTEKSEGEFDATEARSWIKTTLGLSDAQIVVTNGIMRGLSDEKVYGVAGVSVDVLSEITQGTFMFSKYAGRGIHYHEAFHYVNLLLHNKQLRDNIYKEYVKLHPEYKNLPKRQLEELLAEEFREYCEYMDDREQLLQKYSGVRKWLARLLNRFVEFINSWRKKDLISKMYNDIRSGKYAKLPLDKQSVEEFNKAYKGQAYSNFSVPGKKDEDLDKLTTISTYLEFYNTAEAVAHYFLDFANIKHINNVANLNRTTFTNFFEKLRLDNLRKPNLFIQDVINNPAVFLDTINGLLKSYGIVPKNKRAYGIKQVVDEAQIDKPVADNEIAQLAALYDNYEIDLKANVAFRAKLFLAQVKDMRFEFDELTGENKLVLNIDPTTGLPRYYSYSDAWHKITSELHQIDSFLELISTVQRLAKTKAFFAQLYKNLLSVGQDTELLTLIYNTVNKHLVTVAHLLLGAKKRLRRSAVDDEINQAEVAAPIVKEYDENRNIEIRNDNGLKAKKMLPMDWSKDLFASPLIVFDKYHHINKNYVDKVLKPRLKELQDVVFGVTYNTTGEKEKVLQWALPKVVDLLQKMSIPFDDDVMLEYLSMHIKPKKRDLRKKEPVQQTMNIDDLFSALLEILQKPGSSKETGANIAFYITEVFKHSNTTDVKVGKKIRKAIKIGSGTKKLDELYSGFAGGEIEKMAIAYNTVHPSSRELSVTGPDGKLIYPVGENNFISDVTRWINKNHEQFIQKMSSTPYAKNSKILDIARIIVRNGQSGNYEFKLNVFTGIQDDKLKKGVDYFGVNSVEDVISKMILANNNMIILPTMADKKTYYAIELVSKRGEEDIKLSMPHDLLIMHEREDMEGIVARRFSDETLELFANYFLDELDCLDLYYDKKNVSAIINNKNVRRKNFHGKVKNGRMDFSGNGGKFRYFYGLAYKGLSGETLGDLNLNQLLEYEYIRQQTAEDPQIGDGVYQFRQNDEDLDGFESVRKRLKELRNYYFKNGKPTKELFDDINDMLFRRIDDDMTKFSLPGSNQIITYSPYGDLMYFHNLAIPKQLISLYGEKFNARKTFLFETLDKGIINERLFHTVSEELQDLVLSVIGNYVAQSMISIIEVEKVFSGDPVFYKWNYSKKKETKEINGAVYELSILTDKDTDKIKRLGALLSPGSELRTDFSPREYQMLPWLRGTKYINATISDIKARSVYLNEIKDIFKRQLLADLLRKQKADKSIIDGVYLDNNIFEKQLSLLSEDDKKMIEEQAKLQASPYTDITVSDAQVMVRPDMYRKIRMMLGQWSVIPKKISYRTYGGEIRTTMYSDNEAFEILEKDAEWMLDEEKAAKVSRLQLFPLKMTYFKNDPRNICPKYDIAYGLYNKMAIFPAFKYLMRSTTGRQVYNRMNDINDKGEKQGNGVLDMLTFESAVKVGLGSNIYSPYEDKTDDLTVLNKGLEQKSAASLEGDTESWINDLNSLNVEVQDIRGLRMQLNTEAHEEEERAIGTQMFKILFSNIYDDEDYIQNKDGRTPRKGKEIREDIMKCIKALTTIGVHKIKKIFYDDNLSTIDKKKVDKYLRHVAENNGLSESVLEILSTTGTIESLMQRTLFEHSVSSFVNSKVIDINTKGGSAVQQSVFGFISYGADHVLSEENVDDSIFKGDDLGYHILNEGRELSWNEKDGSMEVMLSMNFFKAVVPKEYQKSYKSMRNWLIANNVIKGFYRDSEGHIRKSNPKPFGVGYRIPTQGLSSTFAFTVADVLPEQSGDLIIVPREFTAQTGSDKRQCSNFKKFL